MMILHYIIVETPSRTQKLIQQVKLFSQQGSVGMEVLAYDRLTPTSRKQLNGVAARPTDQ